KAKDQEWLPVTKLGHLVKDMKIKFLEGISLFSPIKESEMIDFFLGMYPKDEVFKITPVQKQTRSKAFIAIGDYSSQVGLCIKCPSEVATVVHGAIILVKLSIILRRRGSWENKLSKYHTVPCNTMGCCGSGLMHFIPTPRGIASPWPRELLIMAGIYSCCTSARGRNAMLGNFAKTTFDAISQAYSYLTPLNLWKEAMLTKSRDQKFTDHHLKAHTSISLRRNQAPAVATT
uniref:Small ribosomal subunit protein uS5 n=1 Tax=Loxodonta africana TaxID=9785 RepID=G3U2N2_LOXAF